ncbi:P-type conjugative transfer protein TrbG [Xenorhabdus bovienii]|uniref:Conjugal transfer protein TrbG n=1 Tax=Xenorhabdus bovienii str. feltiae Moldova TaxID=1398200 RepID=A0A077NTR9_XENBV|nr:P-type conjugative transfer protein TrbG [Xenorhabdus bovienii]CDH02260.1 Conjugal transfer protein TrbG [Xenorhabdus bovienii str. feltiae Moldova]
MKNTTGIAVFVLGILATPAFAQQNVPALKSAHAGTLPPIRMVSPKRVHLDGKEAYGVALANRWKTHPDRPRRGADGSVKYLFGATLPTLVCTPLQVCSIELQPGETVNDVHAGDKARWKIYPATIGSGANATTVIVVKPTDAGLVTNLTVTTDRRLYTIKLASTQREWIPVLSFDYPDDVERQWAAYRAQQARQVYNDTMPTGQNLASLDFRFRMSGDSPRWKPVRIYSDGSKTYIQFPSSNFGGEAPALVALGNDGGLFSRPSEKIVNYRVIGDRYVVDRVLARAALIMGVGRSQTKVIITHGSQ